MADPSARWRARGAALISPFGPGVVLLPLAVSIVVLAAVLWRLPVLPHMTLDSPGYLGFGEDRPPGYPWFLATWRTLVSADLAWLPHGQSVLIGLAILAFATELGRRLRSPLAGAAAVPLLWAHTGVYEASRWVMSEGLFLPAILGGLAATLALGRTRTRTPLVIAALCFSVAILARTTAYMLAAAPLLALAFDLRLRPSLVLRRGLLYVLVLALPLAQGMADHAARYGSFMLGSRGGISLLGKGLLLLRADGAHDPVARSLLPLAAEARAAVAAAPTYGASLRAQAQAFELLRWPGFWAAARAYPVWSDEHPQAQNAIATLVARDSIAADPLGYLLLAARDWTALLLMPQIWQAAGAANSPHPFFAPCADGRAYCWTFYALGIGAPYRIAMIGTAIAGTLGSVLLLIAAVVARRRPHDGRRALAPLALTGQATLVITALFEAGLWRYELAAHPANVAVTLWLATVAWRSGAWRAVAWPRRIARLRASPVGLSVPPGRAQ